MRGFGLSALIFSVTFGWAVNAQSPELGVLQSPVLVLDQLRLFNNSQLADRLAQEMDRRRAALATENREIEAALEAEERELTETRATASAEDFTALADAFDAKVQKLRAEQDAKEAALQQQRDAGQANLMAQISPIIAEIARARGAFVVMDRRSVILAVDAIDITDEAIARIDALLTQEAPATDP